MKNILFTFLFSIPLITFAQSSDYTLSSYLDEGFKAPNTNYIGEAWLNGLLRSDESLPYNITKATFKANSTLNWHKHTTTQVLIFVDGEGYYQEKGKQPIRLKVGDVLRCAPNTEHWHSSSKEKDVTYLAIYSGETEWTEVLSRESYDQVADQLKVN
jgi:quercetin dioxygenase-like cupin family protein